MAHELSSGDVRKFTLLEHLDAGVPKTTNLDEQVDCTAAEDDINKHSRAGQQKEEEEAAARGDNRERRHWPQVEAESGATTSQESTKMDREDVVTVKYMPLKSTTREEFARLDKLPRILYANTTQVSFT